MREGVAAEVPFTTRRLTATHTLNGQTYSITALHCTRRGGEKCVIESLSGIEERRFCDTCGSVCLLAYVSSEFIS